MVLDSAINADAFRAYVDQVLVPTLTPSDIIIMEISLVSRLETSEKQGSRRSTALSSALQPLVNPIEMAFSKLKALLQAKAERSIEALLGI